MEIAIIIALGLAVAIYYGFFDSAETAARMANRKIERLEAEQIKMDIDYYNQNEISTEEFDKAVKQKRNISQYRSL